jgi:hypothetical protein
LAGELLIVAVEVDFRAASGACAIAAVDGDDGGDGQGVVDAEFDDGLRGCRGTDFVDECAACVGAGGIEQDGVDGV